MVSGCGLSHNSMVSLQYNHSSALGSFLATRSLFSLKKLYRICFTKCNSGLFPTYNPSDFLHLELLLPFVIQMQVTSRFPFYSCTMPITPKSLPIPLK